MQSALLNGERIMAINFHKNLDEGIAVEKHVLQIIQKKYPCATLINAYKGYDIWIPEIKKAVEVKYDHISNKTGNIVVEIEMNNQDSGLMTTTADWWCFHDGNVFALIKPSQIIKCILQSRLLYVEFIGNGDKSKKKAYLIPKALLFKYADKLF
jgi:hypothetical protein